jgi:hypothetical protein
MKKVIDMKLIVASILLLVVFSAQAKQACDLELQGGLRITQTALEFLKGDKLQYKIVNDQVLWVKDRPMVLDAKQQVSVRQYAAGIRALVPEVHQLTLEGVDLASDAVGTVFQELLPPNNQTAKQIRSEFVLLRKDIEQGFASNKPININQQGVDDGDFFGADFERRISNIVDASGKEIVWEVMKSLGGAIFSDSERGSFDERMNKFGEKMDREMKARSERLEKHGEIICSMVAALDVQEESLKKSVVEISDFNLIQLKKAKTL